MIFFIRQRFPGYYDAVPKPDCRPGGNRPARSFQAAGTGNPVQVAYAPWGPVGFQSRYAPTGAQVNIGRGHAHGRNIPLPEMECNASGKYKPAEYSRQAYGRRRSRSAVYAVGAVFVVLRGFAAPCFFSLACCALTTWACIFFIWFRLISTCFAG